MTDRVSMTAAMRTFVALSWFLAAGCASLKNPETPPPVPASTAETAKAANEPPADTVSRPTPAVVEPPAVVEARPAVEVPAIIAKPAAIPVQPAPPPRTPVARATTVAPVAAKPALPNAPPKQPVAVTAPPAPVPKSVPNVTTVRAVPPTAAAPLDLKSLETRLRATKSIGVMTKLSLKNQVDDLVGKFRVYHQGHGVATLVELRRHYDMLLLKVLSLLQDSDPLLARDIVKSRTAIWNVLEDPRKFTESNLMAGATP